MFSLHFSGPLAALVLLSALLVRYTIRRLHAHSIRHLPGPASSSWLAGNIPDIVRPKEVGDAEFEWMKRYGTTLFIKGAFGSDLLYTIDPKAIQYVLNTSGYGFCKTPDTKAVTALLTGKGISWADGAQHVRQRKVMSPAFSYPALKQFLPLFHRTAQRTAVKWKDIVMQGDGASAVVDVSKWLARTTLDGLGEAAFNYSFDSITDGDESKIAKVFSNLFADSLYNRSDLWLAFEIVWGWIPEWVHPLLYRIPAKSMQRLAEHHRVTRGIAKSILDNQTHLYATGKEGGKDVMSILIRANLSEDPNRRLDDEEIISQLTSLILAGHESTATSMLWLLHELSKHPEYQSLVREEIKTVRANAAHRGDDELNITDLDSMKYLQATMKETFRYHPILSWLIRQATKDDFIPFAIPQKTKTGEMINGVHVSKGQNVMMSTAAYNRLTSVWGEDANTWRPERFLEGVENNQKTTLGVFANLASFGSGVRGCIGWRFALLETQAVMIELLENFEFSPAPGNPEIIRGAAGIMTTMVKGSTPGKVELPLTVTPLK